MLSSRSGNERRWPEAGSYRPASRPEPRSPASFSDCPRSDSPGSKAVVLHNRLLTKRVDIALVARGIETAQAQDATPSAEAGLPPGVHLSSLGGAPIRGLPTAPFTIQAMRLTVEPGAVVPNSAVPFPEVAYVEEGDGLVCPPGGEGRWVYDADGKLIASGVGPFAFPTGAWCYTAPDTLDGVRNDGTEPASLLVLELIPTT